MVRLLLFLIVVVALLAIGWRQPLRYRFMSAAEIEELENPPSAEPTPEPTPASGEWMRGDRRTPLDR